MAQYYHWKTTNHRRYQAPLKLQMTRRDQDQIDICKQEPGWFYNQFKTIYGVEKPG